VGEAGHQDGGSVEGGIKEMGIRYDLRAADIGGGFLPVCGGGGRVGGKEQTVGREGNHCRLRHRIGRVFRRTCCFSKSLFNHLKGFAMVFLHQFWFRLMSIILCSSPSEVDYDLQEPRERIP
jgi:hypothetical protein